MAAANDAVTLQSAIMFDFGTSYKSTKYEEVTFAQKKQRESVFTGNDFDSTQKKKNISFGNGMEKVL